MLRGFYFSLLLFLLISCGSPSQLTVNQQLQKDTIDFKKELSSIPGKTIGEKMESLLFWSVDEKQRRFPHMQDLFPSIRVETGSDVYPLLNGKVIDLKISGSSIGTYFKENNIGGVIVLKDGKVRFEKYGTGVDENTVWTSFSVGKSITSMLLGVALKDGFIKDLDDPLAKYISELKNDDYGNVTVRQLLTMTSGIGWNEDYEDHNSDVAQMYLRPCDGNEPHILTYMKHLKFAGTPGKTWNYSTGETDLLGILIQKATGKSLAEYLSEKIWKPWGMEHAAYWVADECSGMNLGGSGLSATLRDYARLGMVMLKQGKIENKNLFADVWMKDATSLLQTTGDGGGGYGYLWWRSPNGNYEAIGIFGQMIYINPKTNVVIAQFAAWPYAGSKKLIAGRNAFIKSVEKSLE